jgi:hypothetical protein
MKKKKKQDINLWVVYILPNNQPSIRLGEYYAVSRKIAIEMASVDNNVPVDDSFGAILKSEDNE